VQVFLELVALVTVMDEFDGLLEADGDEETEDDGGDVDEEVSPGAGGVVDVGHGVGFLWSLGWRDGGRRDCGVFGRRRLEGWRHGTVRCWRLI
jgi:hypothetical protein